MTHSNNNGTASSDDFAFVPTPATERRLQLRAAGFAPIPVEGKSPECRQGWNATLDTDAEIISWEGAHRHATNTGILTKFTPALDIDIKHPEAAEALEALAFE